MRKNRSKNRKRTRKATIATPPKSNPQKKSSSYDLSKKVWILIRKFKWVLGVGTLLGLLINILNLSPQIEITPPNLESGIFEGSFDIRNNSLFTLSNVRVLKGLYNLEYNGKKFKGPSVYSSKNTGNITKGENANIIWEENKPNITHSTFEDSLTISKISFNNAWDTAELCILVTFDYLYFPQSSEYRGFSYNKRVNQNEWSERPKICTNERKEEMKIHMDFINERIPEKNFD